MDSGGFHASSSQVYFIPRVQIAMGNLALAIRKMCFFPSNWMTSVNLDVSGGSQEEGATLLLSQVTSFKSREPLIFLFRHFPLGCYYGHLSALYFTKENILVKEPGCYQ